MEENKNIEPGMPDEQDSIPDSYPANTPAPEAAAATPSTIQQQALTTPDMEVHHHAHDPAAPHHKKNWKSYFWEFLMLFLAVFCGFLAEYQLEHVIEKSREKQFIHSILEDIKEDTAALSNTIQLYLQSQQKDDTLIRLLSSEDVRNQGATLYYLGRVASRSPRFVMRDATIQQLKNSGGLRLIRNRKVSKAIIEYYNLFVFINYLHTIEDNEIMEYRKMAVDIFHPVLFNEMVIDSTNKVIRPTGNPSLLTYDPKTLLRVAGMVSYVRNTRNGLATREVAMKTEAIALIELIKNEYHLQ